MLLNLSCPAVSQSCRRTRIPFTYIFLEMNSAPVVEVVFLGSNLFWVYRYNRLVLPTPSKERARLTPNYPPWEKQGRDNAAWLTDLCCPLLRSWHRRLGHIWPANKNLVPEALPSTLQQKRRSQGVKGHGGQGRVEGREGRPRQVMGRCYEGWRRPLRRRSELREPRAPV